MKQKTAVQTCLKRCAEVTVYSAKRGKYKLPDDFRTISWKKSSGSLDKNAQILRKKHLFFKKQGNCNLPKAGIRNAFFVHCRQRLDLAWFCCARKLWILINKEKEITKMLRFVNFSSLDKKTFSWYDIGVILGYHAIHNCMRWSEFWWLFCACI